MKDKLIIAILAIVGFSTALIAGQFRGRVVDEQGNAIANVNVTLEGTNSGTVTDSAGRFSFGEVGQTECLTTFTHVRYQPVMAKLRSGELARIQMRLAVYPIQGITVTADRAEAGKTPVAFTDFTRTDIQRDYQMEEFPLLLETTPNVYAYADAGGGLGYSYLKIRGFSDKQISTYINGVPLNDPEDQATYFVDLPDFAANVKDIQIQRGVGNSLYGDASFGGTVNIVSAGLEQQRQVTLSSGYGGFWNNGNWIGHMEKQSIEYQSGLIAGRWNLSGRYSRQLSDGYREKSWYDGWSYYISAARLDPNMTTTVNVYGGPMRMHLAYYGITLDQIREDRRYNPLTYQNETDNFNQPHYELHNTLRLSDKVTLENTLYHIHGRGYYEQYKDNREYADYNIPTIDVVTDNGDTVQTYSSGDLVRQQWVEKNQYGINPRLEVKHDRGKASFGGSFYFFRSDHWGQVVWAEHVTKEIDPRHRYYQYFGDKYYLSLFAEEDYNLTDRLRLTGNLQYRHQTYKFDQQKIGAFSGYKYDLDWDYLSPRSGLVYALTDRLSFLFSYSLSFRTPADYEIYEANDASAVPSLDVKLEKVHDFELGAGYTESNLRGNINFYWMDFRNEIVPFGGVTSDGLPITANAKRSVHAGVELSGSVATQHGLTFSGNFSYSYNRYKDFAVSEEYYTNSRDWGWLGYKTFRYDNNVIPGFPDYIGNLITEYKHGILDLTYRARAVGRQYVDNLNSDSLEIGSYFVSSASAAIALGSWLNVGTLEFAVRVDNIFNKQYLASGYGGVVRVRDDADMRWAEYIPAAGRSFFSTLKLELR